MIENQDTGTKETEQGNPGGAGFGPGGDQADHNIPGKRKYNASLQLAFKISRFFGKSIEDIFLFEEEE